jgi:SpoVK/Ycf46/Vps4 family AAA+-type ATPase
MERFNGLAVLTTNLRANLDDSFTRRIDSIVDFPMPEDEDRLAIWRMHLPLRLPQADDIDLVFLAQRFRFSGGNIRNVCLMAAFLAADAGRPVGMRDLIRGTEQEYRKLGRLTVEDEFGPYYHQMTAERTRP